MRLAQIGQLLLVSAVAAGAASAAVAKAPPPPTEALVVPTGRAPCGIAARDGDLWVGEYETGRLVRLEATSGRRIGAVRVGRYACRVAVDATAIWVTRDLAGELARVSRATGRVRPVRIGGEVFDVIRDRESVWTTSWDTGRIVRLDARTAKVTHVYEDGLKPASIALCGSSIWVGHGRGATWLTRIDPRSHRVQRVDVAAYEPDWPRCVRGELWVKAGDSVLQVDPRSGMTVGRYRIGGTPSETAAGPDGLVWVTDKERSRIHRIDDRNRQIVDSFAAGPGAFAMARAGQAMWVTSFAGADIRKYVP